MNSGDRVFHPEHPEYGFGTVRLVDESLLEDENICQVAFEWMPGLTAAAEKSLVHMPKLEAGSVVEAGGWSQLENLQRRLGAALVMAENSQTAVFIRAFTMPLPHQAFVLEKILTHRRLGHVIADDVGMGKTIEAGLVIAALRQREPRTRVLIMCPAGVVLQWQDELDEHFGMVFDIAGRNFSADRAANWNAHGLVLASLDMLKQERLKDVLKAAPPFDLVVCDEAHRLTARREFLGNDLYRTQNYRFVEWLVQDRIVTWETNGDGSPRSPRLLLLSATPHQGDDLRFAYLLQLARPDKVDAETAQSSGTLRDATILEECMTRTAKKRAVDWAGKSIFHGHETRTLDVVLSEGEKAVLQRLTRYVQQEMTFKEESGSALVRALAMHTYQKIAASSWAALEAALAQRLDRAEGKRRGAERDAEMPDDEGFDYLGGEGERSALEDVLKMVRALRGDSKWETMRELLTGRAGFRTAGDRLLVFTQYRVTQEHLARLLTEAGERVMTIHGEMDIAERKAQRIAFEKDGTVLISTEAGSEGANFHRRCHLMVNYDLPWNPMRLLQRIGRLDRYGQKKKVKVANLRAPDGWDTQISLKIASKLSAVQAAMGVIVDEDYQAMILGGVHEAIRIPEIMMASNWGKNEAVIEEAIDDAVSAMLARRSSVERLIREEMGMPADYGKGLPNLSAEEFRIAFTWAASGYGVTLRESRTSENRVLKGVYHFTLPEAFRGGLRASKECYLVFDRELFGEVRSDVLGRARGQEIKPTLAGLGDEVTDWFFRGALQAMAGSPVYAAKGRVDSGSEDAAWWVVMAARWKSKSAWSGPDKVWTFEVDDDGTVVGLPTPKEVFAALTKAEDCGRGTGTSRIPALDAVTKICRGDLKGLLGEAQDAKSLALFPVCFVRWCA